MQYTTIIFFKFWYLIDGWMTDGLLYSTCVTGHLISVVGLSRTPSPTHTHTPRMPLQHVGPISAIFG